MEARYGSRVVEFNKGKAGIQVDAIDNLLGAIELVMKVIDADELDEGI